MSKSKPRIIKDYNKLPESVLEQIKLVYPKGFTQHLVSFTTKDGERKLGLPFETDEFIYLIKMSPATAEVLIEEDDDYDSDGVLRDEVREEYQDKYEDLDYLADNANADNEFGVLNDVFETAFDDDDAGGTSDVDEDDDDDFDDKNDDDDDDNFDDDDDDSDSDSEDFDDEEDDF